MQEFVALADEVVRSEGGLWYSRVMLVLGPLMVLYNSIVLVRGVFALFKREKTASTPTEPRPKRPGEILVEKISDAFRRFEITGDKIAVSKGRYYADVARRVFSNGPDAETWYNVRLTFGTLGYRLSYVSIKGRTEDGRGFEDMLVLGEDYERQDVKAIVASAAAALRRHDERVAEEIKHSEALAEAKAKEDEERQRLLRQRRAGILPANCVPADGEAKEPDNQRPLA